MLVDLIGQVFRSFCLGSPKLWTRTLWKTWLHWQCISSSPGAASPRLVSTVLQSHLSQDTSHPCFRYLWILGNLSSHPRVLVSGGPYFVMTTRQNSQFEDITPCLCSAFPSVTWSGCASVSQNVGRTTCTVLSEVGTSWQQQWENVFKQARRMENSPHHQSTQWINQDLWIKCGKNEYTFRVMFWIWIFEFLIVSVQTSGLLCPWTLLPWLSAANCNSFLFRQGRWKVFCLVSAKGEQTGCSAAQENCAEVFLFQFSLEVVGSCSCTESFFCCRRAMCWTSCGERGSCATLWFGWRTERSPCTEPSCPPAHPTSERSSPTECTKQTKER